MVCGFSHLLKDSTKSPTAAFTAAVFIVSQGTVYQSLGGESKMMARALKGGLKLGGIRKNNISLWWVAEFAVVALFCGAMMISL